ncbi:MAG: hypothetical protein NPIRA03_40250 [Nitrospirales bacterium]|nr:MAG: hypothetical protein NPIRA03_40250 [Nitrospirales bacterium]
MLDINPKKLIGPWKEGYALDVHTVSSDYLGEDQFGNARYNTKRSQVGELLYGLKYNKDKTAVKALAVTAAEFIKSQGWNIDVIVSVPATTARKEQPVVLLAEAIGGIIAVPVSSSAIVKVKDLPPLKNVTDYNQRIELLTGAYKVFIQEVIGQRVLLLDDLYRSGATLQEVCRCLIEEGQPKAVYALSMTKTRSNQ